MRLKRLVLTGFKSFKDKTVINFDDGITGVVGPNGCGKSNIVDALFWVMGEQSAKHLRGKTMKDVIFAGSAKHNPASWAEVTLVLENTEGKHIHIGEKVAKPTEIQITRKLYRNSETEYRINNLPARLKDIQEVFMDTGAGAKSYSIIAQGEINRLVQAKPEQRRVMIEEVAGVTKFKLRKKESSRKIEQTTANLNRLLDLQTEIYKNLKSLEKQAEKAEKAKVLKDKIKKNDLIVHSHKEFNFLKDYRDAKNYLTEKTLEIENWKTEKDKYEVDLETERVQKTEMIDRIDSIQGEFNEESRKLAGQEEKLNYQRKNLKDKTSLGEQKKEENQEYQADILNRREKLDELNGSLDELLQSQDEQNDFSEQEEKVELLKDKLTMREETVSELRTEIDRNKEVLTEKDQTLFRNTSKIEEYSNNLEDLTKEIEEVEKQYSSVSTEISTEREEVNVKKQRTEDLEEELNDLKAQYSQIVQDKKEQTQTEKELNNKVITLDTKITSLKELAVSQTDDNEAAADLLDGENKENYSLIGQLIECDEQYLPAVSRLIASIESKLISKDINAQDLTAVIDNKKSLSLLDAITSDKSFGFSSFGAKSLNEIVRINNSSYEDKVRKILNGYFIVEGLEQSQLEGLKSDADFNAIASQDGLFLVTQTGQALEYSIKGESNGENSAVARNNLIVSLSEELEAAREELDKVQELLSQSEERYAILEEEIEEKREELQLVKNDYIAQKTALESKLSNYESANSRLTILQERKSKISKNRLDLMENEEDLRKEVEELKEEVDDQVVHLEELSEELTEQRVQYNEEKESLLQKQLELKTFDTRKESFEKQIEDVENQLERLEAKLESNTEQVENLDTELETIQTEIEELEVANSEKAEELKLAEEALNNMKDSLSELLTQMQEREDKVKKLSSQINKTEKTLVESEVKMQQLVIEEEELVRNIFEKHHIDLRKVLARFLEYTETDFEGLTSVDSMYFIETEDGQKEIEGQHYEFNRRYGQDLKDCQSKFKQFKTELNRLGDINWQAIEDYQRQKLRHDFLKEQEIELKASLDDLEQAIMHIDEKCRQRFKSAFEEVNVRFEKVFPIIFGGGSARLQVVGDITEAECGIEIIAQPPGKKMQNINLMSGGEKALTALSLIFSIFLVKPSPFCLLDEVDAPLDDANVGRFNDLLREMSHDSQFILITHNKKTMELNDSLYGVTMQEPGVSKAVSVQLH